MNISKKFARTLIERPLRPTLGLATKHAPVLGKQAMGLFGDNPVMDIDRCLYAPFDNGLSMKVLIIERSSANDPFEDCELERDGTEDLLISWRGSGGGEVAENGDNWSDDSEVRAGPEKRLYIPSVEAESLFSLCEMLLAIRANELNICRCGETIIEFRGEKIALGLLDAGRTASKACGRCLVIRWFSIESIGWVISEGPLRISHFRFTSGNIFVLSTVDLASSPALSAVERSMEECDGCQASLAELRNKYSNDQIYANVCENSINIAI